MPLPQGLALCVSSHLATSEFHLFIINWSCSKENASLSSVSRSSKLMEPEEGRGSLGSVTGGSEHG